MSAAPELSVSFSDPEISLHPVSGKQGFSLSVTVPNDMILAELARFPQYTPPLTSIVRGGIEGAISSSLNHTLKSLIRELNPDGKASLPKDLIYFTSKFDSMEAGRPFKTYKMRFSEDAMPDAVEYFADLFRQSGSAVEVPAGIEPQSGYREKFSHSPQTVDALQDRFSAHLRQSLHARLQQETSAITREGWEKISAAR